VLSPRPTGEAGAAQATAPASDDPVGHLPLETTSSNGSGPAPHAPSVSAGGGGAAHFALPRLLGAPAYARPPRVVPPVERPFDPDDLPLEAFRTDEEQRLLAEASRARSAQEAAAHETLRPSGQGGLRSIAARLLGSHE
jgi:hypothetical protein